MYLATFSRRINGKYKGKVKVSDKDTRGRRPFCVVQDDYQNSLLVLQDLKDYMEKRYGGQINVIRNIEMTIKKLNIMSESYYHIKWKPYSRPDENDCLCFAESVIGRRVVRSNECLLKPKGLDPTHIDNAKIFKEELFNDGMDYKARWKGYVGNTYCHNVRLAKLIQLHNPTMTNKTVTVARDEALIINYMNNWKNISDELQAPYHVAVVIETTGRTILTVESDAGDVERTRPLFDIYNSSSDGTFWDRHKEMYGGDTAIAFGLIT